MSTRKITDFFGKKRPHEALDSDDDDETQDQQSRTLELGEARGKGNASAVQQTHSHSEPQPSTSATNIPESRQSVSSDNTVAEQNVQDCNQPLNIVYPKVIRGGRERSFRPEWYKLWTWLHWDESNKSVKCYYCMNVVRLELLSQSAISTLKTDAAFVSKGFSNWKKATEKFASHEKTHAHKTSTSTFLQYQKQKSIVCAINIEHDKQIINAQNVLLKIISSLKYLARQGQAIRGHVEKDGNFFQLLKLRGEDVPEVERWLNTNKEYLSHDIQNELLEIMAHSVIRQMVAEINNNKFFALIVDETTDLTTKEQVSVSFRHVGSDFDVHEDFVGLYETGSTTGEALFNIIKDVLLRLNIPIKHCRGQCYDGAANMSGHIKGVQSRISSEEPRAVYVHCFAHSLNLALQNSANLLPEIKDILSMVNKIAVFFSESPKRSSLLISNLSVAGAKSTKLKPLCQTRWTVRASSIHAILSQYEIVLKTLEEYNEAEARGYAERMAKSEFLFHASIAEKIFQLCEELSVVLQKSDITIFEASKSVEVTLKTLRRLNSVEEFNRVYHEVMERATELDLDPLCLPRVRKPPKKLEQHSKPTPPHVFETPEAMLRVKYYEFLNTIISRIEERFSHPGLEHYKSCQQILLNAANNEPFVVDEAFQKYFEEDLDLRRFQLQLHMLPELFEGRPITKISEIVESLLRSPARSLFSQVEISLKLLYVNPSSSASAERSFSGLRRLKTYLRSNMTATRLNSIAVLNFHQEKTDEIDCKSIAKEFILRNERRKSKFGVMV